jgi:Delta3-Delta2-enoyl-CoA isomerase
MKHLDFKKEGAVFVITMIDEANSNTITMDMLTELNQLYDEIEKTPENASLVLASSSAKFFCNGINLQWLGSQSDEARNQFLHEFKRTFLRTTLLNLPTIACIGGHAFAGGAILAASMDFRIMKNDRAKFCYPEVNYGMPLGDTLIAAIQNIPSPFAVQQLVLTGAQWKGDECLARGVVSAIFPEEELLPKTMAFAAEIAQKNRKNYTGLKLDLKPSLVAMWKAQHIK